MKVCNLLKCMMMILFIGMGTVSSMAQKNIDKLLEEIEKRDDASVNSVTKRDPKTRKITSVVKSFSLTDTKMTQRLIEAFEKDEEYTVTAIKDMPKGRKEATRANFTFIFQKDNEKRTYNFSVDPKGTISLSVIIKQSKHGDMDSSDFSLYFNNGMDFEISTMDKEQMKELRKSIQQSLKGLKMKNVTQLKIDQSGWKIIGDELKVSL
ncbi:MAG: DUF5024 domain-containing protein [Bacteroides sp.]|nr:DUF5024 domain-containing protein [Bacteroides sp.]